MREQIECAVVGAGVIGLAVARELARAGREVLILEAEDGIGHHSSSRNSEIIHAGIYYAPGSLKARLCVAGRRALYRYCAERDVAHRRLGKLIVATDASQVAWLEQTRRRAEANGVDDLQLLDGGQVAALEPEVRAVAALHSPSTGIVDSHGLMRALLADARGAGASLVLDSPVTAGAVDGDRIVLDVDGAEPLQLACALVVNAAGHGAPLLARALAGVDPSTVPTGRFAIGHYYALRGPSPFRRLVYPVAHGEWLGVHVTLDLAGRCRFGPDQRWIDRLDYRFDDSRAVDFYAAIRRYWPGLPDGALQPGLTGIRSRIHGPGEAPADFRIDGPEVHGVPGLVNLYGLESPGLTAALAVAAEVAARLGARPAPVP